MSASRSSARNPPDLVCGLNTISVAVAAAVVEADVVADEDDEEVDNDDDDDDDEEEDAGDSLRCCRS